jgi:uncharacterized protein (TIGR02246 family)
MDMISARFFALAPALAAWIAGCAQTPTQQMQPPDTRAANEATIRSLDADFGKLAAAKDFDKCADYYEDDAVLFAPGQPALIGKDSIRKLFQQTFSAPSAPQFAITIEGIDVAKSGDIAEDHGTFKSTTIDKKGKTVEQDGHYILFWKKQADGSWKIAADASANDK